MIHPEVFLNEENGHSRPEAEVRSDHRLDPTVGRSAREGEISWITKRPSARWGSEPREMSARH